MRASLVAVTTPAAEPSDRDLLDAWHQGSARAAEQLAKRHYTSIRRFFDMRAPAFADDLTQQTFLGALEARDRFRGDASFRTFLFAIAHKQLLRHLRAVVPRPQRFGTEDDPGTSLSVVAVRQQEHRLVLMALAQLPVDLQIVIELYYWEGMKTADIGEVLETGASTIGSRLARARELMREHIAAMTRPGPLRERLLGELESISRALGPVTMAANAAAGAHGE